MKASDIPAISAWLQPLADLPLDAEDLARAISTVLQREYIEHRVCSGSMIFGRDDRIERHFWVQAGAGTIIDFRARAILENDLEVPYGVFAPRAHIESYQEQSVLPNVPVTDAVFRVMTGGSIADFPKLIVGEAA